MAARRWHWSQEALTELAAQLERAAFELQAPDLLALAKWVGRGLTAYDALAEALGVPLVADGALIVVARGIAAPLGASPKRCRSDQRAAKRLFCSPGGPPSID